MIKTKGKRISLNWIFLFMLVATFGLAFFFRAYFPYDKIFGSQWIKFNGTDSYFHMRLVDNLVANFPHLTQYDPYHIISIEGLRPGTFMFFDWLLAAIIWMVGFGSPSPGLVDTIGLYFPVILGSLTIVPVYFIGKELFNRWAGIIAAILVALLPGEFLSRSTLGFTDHHVAEVLFSTTGLLFFILAIKNSRQVNISLGQQGSLKNIRKSLVFSFVGGIFTGLYFITWQGAELFIFIIFAFIAIQLIIDHFQGHSTSYLGLIGTIFFVTTALIYSGLGQANLTFTILFSIIVPPILALLSDFMSKMKLKSFYFPLVVLLCGLVIILALQAFKPDMLNEIVQKLRIFLPTTGTELTTSEMMPFFKPLGGGNIFNSPAWLNLYTALPFSIMAFFVIFGITVGKKSFNPEKVLFFVWALVIFLITVQQRRFGYYFTVNAALLTAYIGVIGYLLILLLIEYLRGRSTNTHRMLISNAIGVSHAIEQSQALPQFNVEKKTSRSKNKNKGKNEEVHPSRNYLSHVLAVILISLLVLPPVALGTSVQIAKASSFVPSDGWCEALTWLKDNSPEPFGDPEAYYRTYEAPLFGEPFDYPATAYGVMSWWDYGYYITRIAHRIPVSNPSQYRDPIIETAGVLLAQNEAGAASSIEKSKTAYMIIDDSMISTKLYAIAEWYGQDQQDYYGYYYELEGNRLVLKQYFYPEYYRSLMVRLYAFEGKAVTPGEVKVISFKDQILQDESGEKFSVSNFVAENQTFPDYQQAVDYVNNHGGNLKIVSENPFLSPVPLEALNNYRLVYGSDQNSSIYSGNVPAVKIFEVKAQ
ncbi:MAG: oligosaccharyl transferase, archaeosortase A system-associated [Paludibacter sp.]|nr:oligosaccharyl transferase, archaeosortase A system-associated [Paludibacter sp.]